MSLVKGLAVEELTRRGSIRDLDVARFRRSIYEDGAISRVEAEALFALNEACPVQDASWPILFVEAITDFIVNTEPPEGYVTAENASWLVKQITKKGHIASKADLDLLVSVIDKARWAPESLGLLALQQVHRAVATAEGPLRAGQSLAVGRITPSDVALIRRILYALAGASGIAVTQGETDVLFQIEDALATDGNDPAWTDLFVKAITNGLMAACGYKTPSRTDALQAGRWLEQRGELLPDAMLASLVKTSLGMVWGLYHDQSREERAIQQLERRRIEIITAEDITPVELDWLAARLGRDGRLTANEAALVAVLRTESPRAVPALQVIVEKLGKVA